MWESEHSKAVAFNFHHTLKPLGGTLKIPDALDCIGQLNQFLGVVPGISIF